ncbi:MAG: hypothetical protein MUF52_00560 [Syntrophobacteraceae bacterium]|nr:hypothetical protein [Syntrophobacteraceae bacterium]
MEAHPSGHIDLLASLALDYQRKYQELQQALQDVPMERLPLQLRALAESTTDRFRSAQMQLTRQISHDAALLNEETIHLLNVIFRCFDEMRIVFQMLLEHLPRDSSPQ